MTNQTTGQHTPGAVRAAKLIGRVLMVPEEVKEFAAIIDEETHGPELLAALKGLFRECAMVHKCWGDSDNTKEADAAIKRAESAIAAATKE